MAQAPTRATLQRLTAAIEELQRKVDPAPELALVVVDAELDTLLGGDCSELVCKRHIELYPADARAKTFLIVRTGSTRSSSHSQADRASHELLVELKARLQRPLALPGARSIAVNDGVY